MRTFKMLVLSIAVALPFLGNALATEFTKGVVKKIDLKGKRLTIIHDELPNLNMPAMTMVFFTSDESMLGLVTEGEAIEFVADRIDGKLTVTEIKDK